MLTFGLIGLGRQGQKYINVINGMDNARILSVCSRTEGSYNRLMRRPKGEHYWTKNLDDALTYSEIDCFIIATPVESHYEIARKIIEKGRDVILEKPFTVTAEEAEALERIVLKNAVSFIVNFTHLFQPGLEAILSSIKADSDIEMTSIVNNPTTCENAFREWICHDLAIGLSLGRGTPYFKAIGNTLSLKESTVFSAQLESPTLLHSIFIDTRSRAKSREVIIKTKEWESYWKDDFAANPLKRMLEKYIEAWDKGFIMTNVTLAKETVKLIEQI